MKIFRCALFCLAFLNAALVQGQTPYPSRPITLLVPWVAGGSSDIASRALADSVGKQLGQRVVVENKPGVGGALAAQHMAATAKPDGYTVAQLPLGVFRLPHMVKTNFDPINDLTWILNIAGYQFQGGTISNILTSTNVTSSYSTSTGALQIAGGIGLGGNINIGNAAYVYASTASSVSTSGNALIVNGGIGAYSIFLQNNGYINGSQIVTAATLNQFSGGTINSSLVINSATQATSTITGALQVINGGAGIGGNIYTGGIAVHGLTSNTAATLGTTGTGALQVLGGGSVSGNFNIGGKGYVSGYLGLNTNNPRVQLEVNGDVIVGASGSQRQYERRSKEGLHEPKA